MFQPQATPYSSSFSSYGIGLSVGNFPAFPPSRGVGVGVGVGGGVVESNSQIVNSGPILFREEAANNNQHHHHHHQHQPGPSPHFNTTNSLSNHHHRLSSQHNKMTEHGLQAQTRAAENYERENRIEVRADLDWSLT